uniref:Telomere length regulation protein TEL2 homolog n=1 Tax=Scophthalmus maximus TaxID=52904 RepID=A0A8D3BL60_SCOMX
LSPVRLKVAQCLRTLTACTHDEDIAAALHTLHSYVDEGPESFTTSVQRAEFRRAHYTRALQCLVSNVQADWLRRLAAAQRIELWDGLFLHGPPEQALLVLMEGIGSLRPSTNLDHLVSITERFLQSGRLADLLWSYCLETAPSDSPQLRETLLGRIVALPDLTANRLHPHNKPLFLPRQYYPLLASEMLTALERTCQALKDGTDCSLTFVAQTLGKVCIQGHSDVVLAVLAPRLSACTHSDMVWRRVCWKLLENVPQRWIESVLNGLVQAVSGPDAFGRIIGNLVLTNKKAQFVITHKLLLLHYKYKTQVLRIVLGYLAADRERRPLLIQVLRSVSQAWANPSAVKHTPLEQQLYVTKALLLSVNLLTDSELQELQLLQCLLGGMQSHLDSNVVQIRRVGMVVGECLSTRMDISGTKLKFEYEQDEDTRELLSLMTPAVTSDEPKASSENKTGPRSSKTDPDSDLDSDDELTPYDMSGDQEISQASPPRYLRDCLESTVTQYLTTEFYSLNYSLRQRLDILEVLALAAQELSKPITEKRDPSVGTAANTDLTLYPGDNPVHWRQVVEKRIQSNTKRLRRGATQPLAKATPNRYAPVAGHFFFPLLRNYDRPQLTFDLLGGDHLVLGRLIHTLGLFMMVRRGVLFAVCSVFLSMPSQNLLLDFSDQLFETRTWLAGKITKKNFS